MPGVTLFPASVRPFQGISWLPGIIHPLQHVSFLSSLISPEAEDLDGLLDLTRPEAAQIDAGTHPAASVQHAIPGDTVFAGGHAS